MSGADLCAVFEGLGFDDVASFRTSGNVIFSASGAKPAQLVSRIERGLHEELGYEVPIFLRTEKEVRAIAADEPFEAGAQGKLQVALLLKKPAAAAQREVLALSTGEDRLAFGARELYWLPRGGTQESELDWKQITERLGPTTLRTRGTIELLAAKFFACR